MTTTKKSPRTFALPKKGGAKKGAEPKAHYVDEPTGDAASAAAAGLVPIDDEFEPLPSPRNNDALVALLKSIAGTSDQKIDALTPPITREAFIEALTDDEYARVWTWAREISYVVGDDKASVRESVLVVPACLVAIVDEDLVDLNAMLDNKLFDAFQVVRDLAPAPSDGEKLDQLVDAVTHTVAAIAGIPVEGPNAPTGKGKKGEQLPLVNEPAKAGKPITGLKIETEEQLKFVRKAIDKHLADMTGLAKKNRDEARDAEAKSIERGVTEARERIVPQLKAQGAMAFNEGETLVQTVARFFAGEFRARVRSELMKNMSIKKGETKEDARQRQLAKLDDMEALIGNVGEIGGMLVVNMLTAASDRGYQKGLVAYGATPSAIAREALQALEIERAGKDAA